VPPRSFVASHSTQCAACTRMETKSFLAEYSPSSFPLRKAWTCEVQCGCDGRSTVHAIGDR